MKIYVETAKQNDRKIELDKLIVFGNGKVVYADLKGVSFDLDLPKRKHVYLWGDIFYHIKNDGTIKIINPKNKEYLKKIFSEYGLKQIISSLEGQYIGLLVDKSNNIVQFFSGRYARLDCFYVTDNSDFYFATDLDYIFKNIKPEYCQQMLAHLFLVYSWYTPKGLTIYKNVKQLKVGEIITLSQSGINSEIIDFKPLKIENYTDKELESYYKILRDAVITRANHSGETWVASSSGWDSSMLLALLVDDFGSSKVRMLTGSMEYSKGTDVINKFEINKIKKIGEFYGIKPVFYDVDFKNKTASDYWLKILPRFKSRHMYTFISYSISRQSESLYNVAERSQTIFNGETSDSFHNFGFSQFATFFHTKKSFTEYADKMNCYLYGPSFLKKVLDGTYERDKVFQIFRKMMEGIEFAHRFNSREETVQSYLFPFFYGSPRIPFAKTYKNPALTEKGQQEIYDFPYREYMPEILSSLSEDNMYSWFVYLYHSFHSQGSTVNSIKHASDFNNHKWRMPFDDIRLIDFLSKAPESWGRGLEFNNTKYPLKWVAKNKIKFPYKLLEEGPHSYLYDVIEGFSLSAEITYRSGVVGFFKDTLRNRPYREILGDEYFNLHYLDNLVAGYLKGKEVIGIDFNNLVSLITLCITGWY